MSRRISDETKAAATEAVAAKTVAMLLDSGIRIPVWAELPKIYRDAQIHTTAQQLEPLWLILENDPTEGDHHG